jgi:CRISPR/Cas system-associated exonuclease Cas4 (RecB family)
MKVVENIELKNHFVQKLQEKSAPIREDIHVSDLTFCLRKAYFRKFENRHLSEQQLIFFLDGHQRHEGLQSLVADLEAEKEIRKYGVVGHIDIASSHPIEIKTTRARPSGRKPEHYFRQMAYYCLLTGSSKSGLITQYINDGLVTFEDIEFTEPELDRYLQEMLDARDKLKRAYDTKNPRILPFLGDWQCDHCEFYQTCSKLNVPS